MNESKKLSLAARYRPQTFADVAGQDMVKAVLSRACAEDRPACAYLFSGTRGVGKTTIARIFAKALNCEKSPCAEPCNVCPKCTKIMQGGFVDVIEIDGASNNKIEDIRSLRETVGYAPMEGRYKVFIIDEAHMLTTSAFNALLKTLEEPPPHVIFIMATTEAHKFPVTIISRCQHFTFRHLNEEELIAHLKAVLLKENLSFEEEAVQLLAKRAQGSVRDSMSLLDQTLALGNDNLSVAVTREVLGLAGQEFFEQLFSAMCAVDCAQVVTLTQTLLRRGVDIGFFIRELAGYFRNLFLLQQGGSQMQSVLQLTPGEQRLVESLVNKLSLAHVHAAWQLVLDSQRSVVQSTEPASSLELLLLNLTLLPRLLPLENCARETGQKPPVPQPTPQPAVRPQVQSEPKKSSEAKAVPVLQKDVAPTPKMSAVRSEVSPASQAESPVVSPIVRPAVSNEGNKEVNKEVRQEGSAAEIKKDGGDRIDENGGIDESDGSDESDESADQELLQDLTLDWPSFCSYYLEECQKKAQIAFAERDLRALSVEILGRHVQIKPEQRFQYDRLLQIHAVLERGLKTFLRTELLFLDIIEPEHIESGGKLLTSLQSREELQACFSLFAVDIEHCRKR